MSRSMLDFDTMTLRERLHYYEGISDRHWQNMSIAERNRAMLDYDNTLDSLIAEASYR